MSVQSEIDRISAALANTYSVLEGYGASMPEEQTSDNLAATAATVPVTGLIVTTKGDGSAYTATVPGLTSLVTGAQFVIVPHTTSTSATATLNVNGLGAKYVRQRLSTNTSVSVAAATTSWLVSGKPIMVTYNGTFWVAELVRPDASTIYGTVAIANGGTGAATASDALSNLGAAAADHTHDDFAVESPGISWDTTYITHSSSSIYVRKYGKVVVVRPYVKMNSSATATSTRFQIATGLPAPVVSWYGTMTETDSSRAHTLVVSTDGTMGIQVGSTNSIASTLLRGCITYLTNE